VRTPHQQFITRSGTGGQTKNPDGEEKFVSLGEVCDLAQGLQSELVQATQRSANQLQLVQRRMHQL
jgi:hypothetical protein